MVEYDLEKEKERLKALLESAQDELVDALKQQESLTYRIRKLQEDIIHLAALCGEAVVDPLKDWGLTDAIRYVIGNAKPKSMSATGIRDALVADGYDVSDYSNVMASIHQVIKRLFRKGEILSAPSADGEKRYVWGKGLSPLPPSPERMKKRRVITKLPEPPTILR
jgi:hypothetical protein